LTSTVLYLGCPPPDRAHCQRQLDAANLSIVWADSITSVLAELRSESMPVLIDLSRGSQAVNHTHEVRSKFPLARVFVVADPKHPALATDAVLAGATDVFPRPVSGRCAAAVAGLLPTRQPRPGAVPAHPSVRSEAMRAVMQIAERSSSMCAGLLIRGEPGSGRQFLARAIHAAQHGSGGPFVVFDCASHGADALDRLLFASPARADRRECVGAGSLLHQAAGGTLYLRHVAELPSRLQGRLARVLRDGEAWLAGNGHRVRLDVRPIAGVESGFDRTVDDGRMHDDLVRVLSTIGIDMPPLRQRREDIPAIARDLLRDICALKQPPPRTLSGPALALLAALPWHGNVIELRGLLENIVNGPQTGSTIALDDVVSRLPLNGSSPVPRGSTLKAARAQFEREYIAAALEDSHGRIPAAAELLGLRRTNLYRKLRSLRISETAAFRS
jgi:two-component system nitrogen regulation response regulator NtrX